MKKLLVILSLLIIFVSCNRNKKGESGSDSSEVVAKINGTKITLKQFSEKLEKESRYNPSKYQTQESKKELLDEMVNNELLFQEAKKRNLEDEESIKQMMVRSLIRNYIK
jgi:Tfp pilus assembly protein PilP